MGGQQSEHRLWPRIRHGAAAAPGVNVRTIISSLKESYLCLFLQYVIYVSLRCPQNVSEKFQLKISHRSFIISFWKCLFWVKAETHCFRACLFKCKWAAAPHPFSRIGPCVYSSYLGYSAKKHLFLFWLSCLSLKSCILNHISLNLWYTVFWVHTSEANAQKAAVTRHVCAKLGTLSCLIAL